MPLLWSLRLNPSKKFHSELLSLRCPRHLLFPSLLPACTGSQDSMRQDCSTNSLAGALAHQAAHHLLTHPGRLRSRSCPCPPHPTPLSRPRTPKRTAVPQCPAKAFGHQGSKPKTKISTSKYQISKSKSQKSANQNTTSANPNPEISKSKSGNQQIQIPNQQIQVPGSANSSRPSIK